MSRRLHQTVVRPILDGIAERRLRPGDALPSEVELAARHNVSRGVAREALRALEERGMVAVKHGRGQRIRPEAEWRLLHEDVLLAFVTVGEHTDLLLDAVSIRTAMEADAAAALAAPGAAEPAAVGAAVDRFAATLPFREQQRHTDDAPVEAEAAIHRELLALGTDPLRRAMLAPLHVPIAAARHTGAPARDAAALRQHRKLLAAIARGDAAAAREAVVAHGRQLERWLKRG